MRKDLELYLNNLTYFRNVCAHDERFYNFRTKKPITNTEIHDKVNLPRNCSGNFEKGKTDLFSLLIIIKRLSESASFEIFVEKLNDALQNFLIILKIVTKEYFLAQMGFPSNWKEIEKMPNNRCSLFMEAGAPCGSEKFKSLSLSASLIRYSLASERFKPNFLLISPSLKLVFLVFYRFSFGFLC